MTRLRVLSLGAGVQSSTLALMAAHGEIEPPDCAIFADTQDEGAATYQHLAWLEAQLPYPVHRVSHGHLSEALFAGDDEARIPAFVQAGGLANRQCTRNYKIREIRRTVRRLLGVGPNGYIAPGTVEQWIGISRDEADRMKPSGAAYIVNRFPLIERRMGRYDCLLWLERHGFPKPPKSACVYCAYQSDEQWAAKSQADFAHAVSVDERLRSPQSVARFRGRLFLHRSCQPLGQVDFPALLAAKAVQGDLFSNDCTGVCGV